ncbi:class I SAM-dependent methyltransferase [Micromonospora maritima]|uniref:Class I SAM-dependent methyltransferase n=1 Tax=Micromonospora maritima TaxID=986711 RepID=A0ABW7ZI96_9ACTN
MTIQRDDVVEHFAARARTYDRSSSWCTDEALGAIVLGMAQPGADDAVLDVACGTGLVSRLFSGRVARVVGVDITADMAEQAQPYLDEFVLAPAESLPFEPDTFDVVVCRQGIQFMTLPDAVREMVRVTKPGGRIVLINLCAYGDADRDEYFEVLRLRNPVRRNFFLPDDLARLMTEAGCDEVETERYVSVEDVDAWSDNGAIGEDNREAIREVYRNASPAFQELHSVRMDGGRFVDQMLFVVARGVKPAAPAARNAPR